MLKCVTAEALACQALLCASELDDVTGVLDGLGNAYCFNFGETILTDQVNTHPVFSRV